MSFSSLRLLPRSSTTCPATCTYSHAPSCFRHGRAPVAEFATVCPTRCPYRLATNCSHHRPTISECPSNPVTPANRPGQVKPKRPSITVNKPITVTKSQAIEIDQEPEIVSPVIDLEDSDSEDETVVLESPVVSPLTLDYKSVDSDSEWDDEEFERRYAATVKAVDNVRRHGGVIPKIVTTAEIAIQTDVTIPFTAEMELEIIKADKPVTVVEPVKESPKLKRALPLSCYDSVSKRRRGVAPDFCLTCDSLPCTCVKKVTAWGNESICNACHRSADNCSCFWQCEKCGNDQEGCTCDFCADCQNCPCQCHESCGCGETDNDDSDSDE